MPESDSFAPEEIAARAYDIYEREGRTDGKDMEHWLRAEEELRSERNRAGDTAARAQANGGQQQNLPRSARLQQEQQGSSAGKAAA